METTKTDVPSTNGAPSTHPSEPRLDPIDEPDSWWVWLAYKMTEWMEGTVITPVKVIQARLPESLRHAYETQKLEEALSVPPALRLLLKRHIAALNGCAFCVDLAEADAQDDEVDVQKLREAAEYEADDRFSKAEQAALAYAEAVTVDVHVEDAVFDALRGHFSEREIVEITWLCATENYYNRLNAPLGIGSDGLCSV